MPCWKVMLLEVELSNYSSNHDLSPRQRGFNHSGKEPRFPGPPELPRLGAKPCLIRHSHLCLNQRCQDVAHELHQTCGAVSSGYGLLEGLGLGGEPTTELWHLELLSGCISAVVSYCHLNQ
ncbi:hypothetical protein Y1Q_0008618 [Alligator mississippiensis]|uniref:Uncharacterized protein n=1 Tax=Alligator mississippiensis TaxID=8496 RepID=A0A151N9E7_ALLMI|nr:hypothetical protein Y1Q_0008618 [Alligator mississippiensis]